jgi:hypothetical protein
MRNNKFQFPNFISMKSRNEPTNTSELWKVSFYEHLADEDNFLYKTFSKMSFFTQIRSRIRAFLNPTDFVLRVMAVHTREIMNDVEKRLIEHLRNKD